MLDPGRPPSWANFGRNGWFHPLQGTRRSWLGVLGEKKGFSEKKKPSLAEVVCGGETLPGFPLPWSGAILLQRAHGCVVTWGLAISHLRRFPTSLRQHFLQDLGCCVPKHLTAVRTLGSVACLSHLWEGEPWAKPEVGVRWLSRLLSFTQALGSCKGDITCLSHRRRPPRTRI